MSRLRIKPISVEDNATSRALDDIRAAMPDLSVFDGARLVENVELTSGTTRAIPHGLGRKLRGWLVVRVSSGAALGFLYDEQASSNHPDKYLYLRAEGYSPTVSLLVF